MTNEQAAQILRDHNKWRRHDSDEPMPMPNSPTILGQAIDVAVKALEQPEPTELERFKAAVAMAFSDYRKSESCSCCRDNYGHEDAEKRLAALLNPKPYEDGSGWDWDLCSTVCQ